LWWSPTHLPHKSEKEKHCPGTMILFFPGLGFRVLKFIFVGQTKIPVSTLPDSE
jgi:hypothetical protein